MNTNAYLRDMDKNKYARMMAERREFLTRLSSKDYHKPMMERFGEEVLAI